MAGLGDLRGSFPTLVTVGLYDCMIPPSRKTWCLDAAKEGSQSGHLLEGPQSYRPPSVVLLQVGLILGMA